MLCILIHLRVHSNQHPKGFILSKISNHGVPPNAQSEKQSKIGKKCSLIYHFIEREMTFTQLKSPDVRFLGSFVFKACWMVIKLNVLTIKSHLFSY